MAKWTTATRKAYYESHPENFAGEGDKFPIKDGSDVADAWGLAGHADNPDAVRAKIKSIAKRLGLTSSLPDTATENEDKERSMGAEHMHEALTRAANHDPFTGTHSHAHPAFGSQGDDETHEHEHSHDNDNKHEHEHAERIAGNDVIAPEIHSLYAPIVRTDTKEWIIEGQVTSDQVDHYGTIFDYEASKKAFQNWRGNIREQHDSKKAVGRAIEVIPDDATRTIFLRARISKGARDTWEKILDGTLSGFSVGADPHHVETTSIVRNGKSIPVYRVGKWAEVSVVDNPGSPGCDFVPLVRADGMLTDIIDNSEEDTPVVEPVASLSRAGARLSSETKSAMHSGIGHTLKAAVSQMNNCGCEDCQAAMKMIDPDGDGDIDMGGYDDPDNDWQAMYAGSDEDMERKLSGLIERVLEQKLSTVYTRLQGIAGMLARSNAAPSETTLNTLISGAIERAVQSAVSANESNLAEVRASQEAVKEQVDEIAKQVQTIADTPVPGAPVMNAGALPRPVEKQLATDPYQLPVSRGATADAVAALFNAGQLDTTDKQVNAVAAALAAQRRGR